MIIQETTICGLVKVCPSPIIDERGYFMRTYDESIFKKSGLQSAWKQENQSLSNQEGIVRGLHFQRGEASETKLVRCLQGEVFDVAVDIRLGSKTFGQHFSLTLSAENKVQLYIPKGFAHGFFVTRAPAILAYKVDNIYTPAAEGGLLWNDPELQIQWPSLSAKTSEKDKSHPKLKELEPIKLNNNEFF